MNINDRIMQLTGFDPSKLYPAFVAKLKKAEKTTPVEEDDDVFFELSQPWSISPREDFLTIEESYEDYARDEEHYWREMQYERDMEELDLG